MLESRAEIDLLLELMDLDGRVTVANGAEAAIADEDTPAPSAGAELIIAESMLATGDDPLFVAFLGPLTDMATRHHDGSGDRDRDVIVVWIGGMGYGVDWSYPAIEFNLRNDIPAANVVFDSGITSGRCPPPSTRWSRSATPSSRRRSAAPASSPTT